jgi:hypothetical protein
MPRDGKVERTKKCKERGTRRGRRKSKREERREDEGKPREGNK